MATGKQLSCHGGNGADSHELAFLERARNALAQADSFEQVKAIHDEAEAVRVYARSAAMGLEIQNHAAEIKLRAERKAGEFLSKLNLRGGNQSRRRKISLDDIGISRQQSCRWQIEASLPDRVFEAYVQDCVRQHREMSSAAVIRLAKKLNNEDDSPMTGLSIADVDRPIRCAVDRGAKYRCIYVTPPWPTMNQRPTLQKTPSQAQEFARQLKKVRVYELGGEQSHLHLRCPSPYLAEAVGLLRHWRYTYGGALAVVRNHGDFTQTWRQSCDLVLLGVRGELGFRESCATGWLDGASEREVGELLARVSYGPFLAVFANGDLDGWDVLPDHRN